MGYLKFVVAALIVAASGYGGHWLAQYQAKSEFIRQVDEHIASFGYTMEFTCEPPLEPNTEPFLETLDRYDFRDFVLDGYASQALSRGGATLTPLPTATSSWYHFLFQGGISQAVRAYRQAEREKDLARATTKP